MPMFFEIKYINVVGLSREILCEISKLKHPKAPQAQPAQPPQHPPAQHRVLYILV